MTPIQNKTRLLGLYITEALRLKQLNGMVDDYDICKSVGDDFLEIANIKLPILTLLEHLIEEYEPHEILVNNDKVSLYDSLGISIYTFSFLLTPLLSFSGNIGINAISYDAGISKHIEYLSLFFPPHEIINLKTRNFFDCYESITEESILEFYTSFYTNLMNSINNNPMSLYNLLTGIKKNYNISDNAVLLQTDGFSLIDFTKLKKSEFINNFSEVNIEASDTSPMLKFSYQGNKLLHLRTKLEKKNSSFKLRFFIETTSKFINLFKKE